MTEEVKSAFGRLLIGLGLLSGALTMYENGNMMAASVLALFAGVLIGICYAIIATYGLFS